MGPVARARLGWAEAVVPRTSGASGIIETEAGVNVRVFVEVFEEGFASIAVRMMVMMMIRTGHHGGRMVECNVLAREWFRSVRRVRARVCVRVSVMGRSGAEGSATRKGTAMRTGRSASSSQSCATVMAAAATMTAAAATAAAMTAAAGARGRRRCAPRTSASRGEDRTDDNQCGGEYNEFGKHGIPPNRPMFISFYSPWN